jgi:hypothetical protein
VGSGSDRVTTLPSVPCTSQEAVQCVQELASTSLLFIFVRHGIESTLERSTIAREHMGRLLHQLLCVGHLSTAQYYQGYDHLLWASYVWKLTNAFSFVGPLEPCIKSVGPFFLFFLPGLVMLKASIY